MRSLAQASPAAAASVHSRVSGHHVLPGDRAILQLLLFIEEPAYVKPCPELKTHCEKMGLQLLGTYSLAREMWGSADEQAGRRQQQWGRKATTTLLQPGMEPNVGPVKPACLSHPGDVSLPVKRDTVAGSSEAHFPISDRRGCLAPCDNCMWL